MADRGALVKEFSSISGLDIERSTFHLEAAGWDLHAALSNFYDNDASVEGEGNEDAESARDAFMYDTRTSPRFASAADFHSKGESSDSEEGQAFYAGGSERSGQQILGPPKKADADSITKDVFEAARRHGARTTDEEESHRQQQHQGSFKGAGFRLGSDALPSEQVTPSLSGKQSDRPAEIRRIALKFWSNGFSLDDGPLRSFDDPVNSQFLDSVKKGEVPQELMSRAQGQDVNVEIEDHRGEEYVRPKPKLTPFQGVGQMLGSPVPQVTQNTSAALSTVGSDLTFELNENSPITTVQIRLADGTRLVSKFNHDSTVGDVRHFIQRSRPNVVNFKLVTAFPAKELSDDSQTLEGANLLNSVLIQRLT